MPLVDPTCGSGTFAIEAALWARHRAPGIARRFAFESWPDHDTTAWQALLASARAGEQPGGAAIVGHDIDPDVVVLATAHAARAEVAGDVSFTVADVTRARLPDGPPGLVVANPPYGVRLKPERAADIYRALGRLAASAPGWRLAFLATDERLARAAGLARARHRLTNGGMPIGLYLVDSRKG